LTNLSKKDADKVMAKNINLGCSIAWKTLSNLGLENRTTASPFVRSRNKIFLYFGLVTYHKDYLEKEIEKIDPALRKIIKIELSPKITPWQKRYQKPKIRLVVAKRWLVERTNAWINQCRALWKNCEGLLETSETKIRICAIRLILRRIA
jgi:Transposase DDE domain